MKSADDTRREVLALIETEGIRAAAQAAIDVARDPKAAPNARATAAGLLLRAAALGGFGRGDDREGDTPPEEMSPDQLSAAAARAMAQIAKRDEARERTDDVFD